MIAVICHDHTDGRSAQNRQTTLKAHLDYIESIMQMLAVAGPLRDENGNVVGSLLVYKVDTRSAAQNLLEADPYFSSDVWARIDYRAFKPAAGEWVGGKSW